MYQQKQEIFFTRVIVGTADHRFAVVSCLRGGELLAVQFALPPDSEPTGRLWARLEKQLSYPTL